MAEVVVKGAAVAFNGLDISGLASDFMLHSNQEVIDKTAVGNVARNRHIGLVDSNASVNSYWDSDVSTGTGVALDAEAFNGLGGTSSVLIAAAPPDGFTTGNRAWFGEFILNEEPRTGSVGELLNMNLSFVGAGGAIAQKGTVIFYSAGVDSSTEGPGFSLGAVTSTQRLYGAISVLRSTGTAITGKLVSSTAEGNFTLSTTRLTFTATTGQFAEFSFVAGAITDTAFRFELTSTATPDATVLCVASVY